MDKPLISLVVVCYNQAAFIREAVESALAQTYSPLEVIVIDDCSKDASFSIAQEVLARYQGPHRAQLCRNPKNLGIGGNINRAMELCRGELIVGAAGDDISLPTRVEVTVQAWEQSGRRATSIFSSYVSIAENGEVLDVGGRRGDLADQSPVRELTGDLATFLSGKQPAVNGCTHAWSPMLFKFFGPLSSDLEDLVLSFRTLAVGKMLYVHEPLVKYRRHGANVSFLAEWNDNRSFEHREQRLRWVDEKTTIAYDNMLLDIGILEQTGRISAAERARLSAVARRARSHYAIEAQMMAGNFFGRMGTLARAAVAGNLRGALRFLPRLLPRFAYRKFYLFRERLKSGSQSGPPRRS